MIAHVMEEVQRVAIKFASSRQADGAGWTEESFYSPPATCSLKRGGFLNTGVSWHIYH